MPIPPGGTPYASYGAPYSQASVSPNDLSVMQRSAQAHTPGQPQRVPGLAALGGGRIEEEVACLRTIAQCLEASFRFHSSPVPVAGGGNATSMEETSEFFELIVSLLSADGSPSRLAVLIFDTQPSIIDLLASLLEIPTPAHQLGNKAYIACRVICTQTLTKIISLCTDDTHGGAPTISERCVQHISATPFIRTALAHLSPISGSGSPLGSGSEAIRVAYAECLFVLGMRSDQITLNLIQEGGVKSLFDCVFTDASAMVRNYACAILRILSERAPEQFLQVPIVEKALMQIKVEHSKYVVILLFETLSILFYACPQIYLDGVHDDMTLLPEMYNICQTFLSGNTNYDVLSAVVKVMEAALLLESSTSGQRANYTMRLLTQGTTKVLLQRDAPEDVKVLKIRLFRKLIQACTNKRLCEELHEAFTHFFPSLSLLINADGGSPEIVSDELRSELALCFAVLLAKHPLSREYTHHTVKNYPVWIGQLRQHLLKCIDEVSPPVLNGCHIVDVQNVYLNSIHHHTTTNWSDRVQVGQLVAKMMHDQANGVSEGEPPHVFVEESMDALPGQLSDMERKARLTHALLTQVIHSTLVGAQTLGASSVAPSHPFEGVRQSGVFPPPPGLPVQNVQNSFEAHESDAFTDLQNYASGASLQNTPSARGRQNAKRLRGIFSKSPSRAVPDKRPPWNGGGNSGKKALFSAPKTAKRTEFFPGNAKSPGSSLTYPGAKGKNAVPDIDSDYTDMAILMHLPITFGANYNRSNKPTVRRFNCGSAVPYVQQTVKSNTFQSWDVKDVGEGDLFSFFIPFHKLTESRIEEEIRHLHKHRLRAKKGHVTTPQHQRGKRWFYYDMLNYVLNKTEALLSELRDLVAVHGQSNILFYLNIIRLMDNKEDEEAKALLNHSPPRHSTTIEKGYLASTPSGGMTQDEALRESLLQREVLKLSQGKYKDTIHGGNILYVLDRLKAYFAENFAKGDMQISDHLKDIEEEIRKLEEKAIRDVIGNEAEAEAEDDVESAYDESVEAPPASLGHHLALGAPPAHSHPRDGVYDEPDFSTETESDVAYNLDRLRLGELDDSDLEGDIKRSFSATLPTQGNPNYHAHPRDVSPNRHRHNAIGGPPASHARVLAGDEWDSESSDLSF